jgi:DNA invertase Pin-like site-specific DNA recombinase
MTGAGAKGARAALYVRVSTTSKSRYGDERAYDQRPELQEELLRSLAEARRWTVAGVYSDRVSGADTHRPGLEALMRDARKRIFDIVLVWRFDRWSRSVLHFLQLTAELGTLGVDFVAHEQALDSTTAMGKFTMTMFGALAELERAMIRDRAIAGLEYAKAHGTKSGKPIGRPRAVFDREVIVELRNNGLSWRQIAAATGLGCGTVRRAHAAWSACPGKQSTLARMDRDPNLTACVSE